MSRGLLRVYLGAAPGVGKTYALLSEGRRRHNRGASVVLATIVAGGRPALCELADGLPVMTCADGRPDVCMITAVRPKVVLVDDLAAHAATVDELLVAGIDVVTTLDISQLRTMAPRAALITGMTSGVVVDDEVLAPEVQVELIDMTPAALCRRLAHGNILPAEAIDAEAFEAFRPERLAALRSLAFEWMTARLGTDGSGPGENSQPFDRPVGSSDEPLSLLVAGKVGGVVPLRRELFGAAVALFGLPALTAVLSRHRTSLGVAATLLLYLLVVVAVAAIGGKRPAMLAAVGAPLLANWYLIPPLHAWHIGDQENVIALTAFVTVAAVVSALVSIAARRTFEADRAGREAATLARLAADLADPDPLAILTEHLRTTFHLDGVTVLRRDALHWHTVACAGRPIPAPKPGLLTRDLGGGAVLVLDDRELTVDDRRVLDAFVSGLTAVIERRRLHEAAERVESLDRANVLRTAILQSVSHDLRTPLAAIKANVSSLRQTDIDWPPDIQAEFIASIDHDTDRLTALVTNLLDVSRLQAGAVHASIRSVSLEEVLPAAIHSLGSSGTNVQLDLPEHIPEISSDPALLERVVANLIDNAIAWSPASRPVRVRASRFGPFVYIHVVDQGPGIAAELREQVVQPFQRLGDSKAAGVGLGLAIATGFTSAIGGELTLQDTPGGGLTAVVKVPAAL